MWSQCNISSAVEMSRVKVWLFHCIHHVYLYSQMLTLNIYWHHVFSRAQTFSFFVFFRRENIFLSVAYSILHSSHFDRDWNIFSLFRSKQYIQLFIIASTRSKSSSSKDNINSTQMITRSTTCKDIFSSKDLEFACKKCISEVDVLSFSRKRKARNNEKYRTKQYDQA